MKKLLAVLGIAVGCFGGDLGRYTQGGMDINVYSGMSTIPVSDWPETPVLALSVAASDPDIIGVVVDIRVTMRDRTSRRGYSSVTYSRFVTLSGKPAAIQIETPSVALATDELTATPVRKSSAVILKIPTDL